ncbi:ATP-dependent Clp protease ATP-binding subunit [bacterium]|nr:ATP-dependent Clp protease ATP-binding subunit [bacterium]
MLPKDNHINFNRSYLSLLDKVEKQIQKPLFRFLIYLLTFIGAGGIFYLLIGICFWPSDTYLGLALLALLFFVLLEGYLGYYGFLKNYIGKVHFHSANLVDYLNLNLYRIFREESENIRVPELMLRLMQEKKVLLFLQRLELSPSWLKEILLKEKEPRFALKNLLEESLALAFSLGEKRVDELIVFLLLLEIFPLTASILHRQRIERKDLILLYRWFKNKKSKKIFQVRFTGGIARDWTIGYSPILDRFAVNLAYLKTAEWETLAHRELKEELENVLIQSRKGNVLLVGKPGIGKRSLVIALAQDLKKGICPFSLAYKRILEIKMEQVLTSGKDEAGIRSLFGEILNDVFRAGDVILYFDDFSVLCGGGRALGKANLIDLILPYLKHPAFQIIASISPGDYEHYIVQNQSLMESLNFIEIKEPNYIENFLILEGAALTLESKSQLFFSYLALRQIIELSERYFWQEPFPIKSIHLLEKISQKAVGRGVVFITKETVSRFFEEITKIKVGEVREEEKTILLHLEEILHERIVDQKEAIKLLAEAIRIRRAGIKQERKPMGSFLFLGPTGVGKTETAKAITEAYFGSEGAMVRFDMSEFQNKKDVYRFIGHFETNFPGELIEAVKQNPSGVILLDEFEKAHPDILNLFLQVLDEGFLTDVFGQKVYFTNHIIIATSSAGSNYLVELLKKYKNYKEVSKKLVDYLIQERVFRAELLNRFNKVIVFKPLGPKEIYQIAELKLAKLKEEIYRSKRIELEVAPEVLQKLAKAGFKPEFGARELERVIREKIESLVAQKIIQGQLKAGAKIVIRTKDL